MAVNKSEADKEGRLFNPGFSKSNTCESYRFFRWSVSYLTALHLSALHRMPGFSTYLTGIKVATPYLVLYTGLRIDQARLVLPGPHRHNQTLRPSHRYSDPHQSRVDPSGGMAEYDRIGGKQTGLATGRDITHETTPSVVDPLRL